jgi:acyl carrier protein
MPLALIIALTFLSGCGYNSSFQNSSPKAESSKASLPVSLDNENILSSVRNIVAKQLSLDAGAVDVDLPLSKQKAAADELDVVEIIMNIEDTFGIEIKDEEVGTAKGNFQDEVSVRKLADIVARKKKRN